MAGTKKGKPRASTAKRSVSVLDAMQPGEHEAVLRRILDAHPELRTEAEAIATEMLSAPSVEEVADDVCSAVRWLDLGELSGRAGRQPGRGYVRPDEAAWELLEEAVEETVEDMKRRAAAGLRVAAEAICCGIVRGLYAAEQKRSDGLLAWAPDFPTEMACVAVRMLIQALPAEERPSARDRLLEALERQVGDWDAMLEDAANQGLAGR
jgi:hypothetical protein